jgi:hypothetical protein
MIKLTTTQAHAALLVRHRKDIASQVADRIETLFPVACKHRDGRTVASCMRCAERRILADALNAVCDTGGIPRRGEEQ